MKVGAGDTSRAADCPNNFAPRDSLPLAYEIILVMRVNRNNAIGVLDDHHIAISTQLIAIDNVSCFDGSNRCPLGRGNVQTVMKAHSTRPEA